MAKKTDMLEEVSEWLVIVGGINWGSVGLFNLNMVKYVFGTMPLLETGVYVAVSIGAGILAWKKFQ